MSLGFVDWRTKTSGRISYAQTDISARGGVRTILVSDRLANRDTGLLIRILQDHDLGELYAESAPESVFLASATDATNIPASNRIGELRMAVASQQLDRVGRHVCGRGVSSFCYRSTML